MVDWKPKQSYKIFLFYHLLFALDLTISQTLNVAGVALKLPLQITVIGFIECTGKENFTCPLGPMSFGLSSRAILSVPLAQKIINADPNLWPFHNMTVVIKNTYGFPSYPAKLTISSAGDDSLAIFGLESLCDNAAMAAGYFNKLAVAHVCPTSQRYPSTLLLTAELSKMADAAIRFLKIYDWDRVVIVYFSTLTVNAYENVALHKRLKTLLLENQIMTIQSYVIPINSNAKSNADHYLPQKTVNTIHAKILSETFLMTRVYILLSAVATGADVYFFTNTMAKMGLLQTGEYQVMSMFDRTQLNTVFDGSLNEASTQYFLSTKPPQERLIVTPSPQEFYQHYRSVALIGLQSPLTSQKWQTFSKAIVDILSNPCPPLCNYSVLSRIPLTTSVVLDVGLLYEAIYQYAVVASKVIIRNLTDVKDGRAMMQQFANTIIKDTLTGIPVSFDNMGASLGSFILSTASYDQKGKPGVFSIGTFNSSDGKTLQLIMNKNASFNWLNGKRPPPRPRCGFTGELCDIEVSAKTWIIAALTVNLIIALFVFAVYFYRKKSYEKKLEHSFWKILLNDLVLQNTITHHPSAASIGSASSVGMISSAATFRMHRSRTMLQKGNNTFSKSVSIDKEEKKPLRKKKNRQRITIGDKAGISEQWENLDPFSTALYRGNTVALKRVYKTPVNISRSIAKELLKVTSLSQENINRLIGVVYETPVILLVSEYCQKGSLRDMLENDEISLDHIFLASIVFDIINGIQYLQSSYVGCHGRLKSTNCLIDARWIIKLSDFGLFQFLQDEEKPLSEEEKCEKLLWTAPEILRDDLRQKKMSPVNDVYSFGIILHEVFGRQGVFGESFLDPILTIQKIKFPRPQEPLFRPDMRLVIHAPDCVRETMEECWREESELRPSFSKIKKKLEPLKAGLSHHIMDNMVTKIENYNNNLEGLIAERTAALALEKGKADALLSSMMPKQIAELLKHGQAVEPEHFESASIYFSDIVGFAEIINKNTPFQVVNFLHRTYAAFDSMLSHFDVYKVETIGDSYMVVSGLPSRNGDNHAGEIASMALRFLKAAKDRKIHQPSGELVQLRVGLHSGPCVAGVVGLKMPRYCLFGDTINTTSRMQSSGEGLKIHCSGAFKCCLDKLGGYEIVERGYVAMKGKGEQLTYWLLEEDATKRQERIKKH